MSEREQRVRDVYERLSARYGPQRWWPGDGPFEVIVGAIPTQRTAWTNAEKALANLKRAGVLSPAAMMALPVLDLAELIRPSGFYRSKARKLRALLDLLFDRFAGDLDRLLAAPGEDLRTALLATHGIGAETGDAILLYAARRPFFVVDAYARRTFGRLGMRSEGDTYESWRRLFEGSLAPEAALFGEYHALIVAHGKDVCRAEPLCDSCVLAAACSTRRAASSTPYAGRTRSRASSATTRYSTCSSSPAASCTTRRRASEERSATRP